MDDLIRHYDGVEDGDLMICEPRGVAYQMDMTESVEYGKGYFDKYISYEGTDLAKAINDARCRLVSGLIGDAPVLDIGIGSGEFIKTRKVTGGVTHGTDINRDALKWLRRNRLSSHGIGKYKNFTMWDVIEHIRDPFRDYFRLMPQDSYLFTAIPIFVDLKEIRSSRHYRPNEHYYYFTNDGFIEWMNEVGFCLRGYSYDEITAGRDSIVLYAFQKSAKVYNDNVGQYSEIHSKEHYGSSANLYFQRVAEKVIRLNPTAILDYGCGRSNVAVHFWADGQRKIIKYDPAIPAYKRGDFAGDELTKLVLCMDVLEHIAMKDLERVLMDIRSKSRNVIFSISIKLARKKLPDGRNAHITIMTKTEWIRWVQEFFPGIRELDSGYGHILLLSSF